MSYLALSDIKKRYGKFLAIDDLSLTVEDGEFICFLGPSGCGKTTLLRIIAGLDLQTSGKVEIAGQDCSTAPPEARNYGIVFQSYALFPNLSVAGNVGYGITTKDKRQVRDRIAAMLELVDLSHAGDKYPGQLSGGQQQRVALARALAPSPRLLLLDEPLSALDARVRVHLRRQIRALHDRLGLTTIMVTHDQEEALTMADRIVVMNKGRIEQTGRPQQIYAQPASLFVADFVGAMNIFPGIVTDDRRVRIGSVALTCEGVGAAGAAVTVCWRPEDVVIGQNAEGIVNPMLTRIEAIEFLGPFHRALLRMLDGDMLFTADFSANMVRDAGLAAGREMLVGLPSNALHIFPERPC
jgi:iron(III) transport system ATP-binding protein